MHSCSKLFTCSSWRIKRRRHRGVWEWVSTGQLRCITLKHHQKFSLDLKSINIQYGDGEGFIARVDPTVDALCQPTKQQRVQDLGNGISMKKHTIRFLWKQKNWFLWKQRTSEKSLPKPWHPLSSHGSTKDLKRISKTSHPLSVVSWYNLREVGLQSAFISVYSGQKWERSI